MIKKKILAYNTEFGPVAAIGKYTILSATYYIWKRDLDTDYIKPERKIFFRKLDPEQLRPTG